MNTQNLHQLSQMLLLPVLFLLISHYGLSAQTPCELIYNTFGAHSWTVPEGVSSIEILAIGGDGGNRSTGVEVWGGSGAQMTASFTVSEGDVLDIYVGEYGTNNIGFETGGTNSGGGGGGTAVILNQSEVLIVAAGGGGASVDHAGGGGQANTDSTPGAGASNGNVAGGGGGFNADAPGDLGGKKGTLTGFGAAVQGAGLGWGSGGGRTKTLPHAGGGGGYKGGNASFGSSSGATGGDSFVNTAINSGTVISNIAGTTGGGSRSNGKVVITLIDDVAPEPICKDMTVSFNGGDIQLLAESDLWDPLTSTDNCGDVYFMDQSVTEVDCSQVGNEIPVTVVVEDDNGNLGECIAQVKVEGLPCGYSADINGINCFGGNQASYDPDADSFSVTSVGCYNPNYYQPYDAQGYVGTSLCGDGEIEVQVTSVVGNGWAGISMREGLGASDKMLQLSIDGVSMSRRALRQSTGATAFAHQFPTQGKNWLKLTRSGNTFGAYHSSDGISWQAVLITNISMTNCIDIGMFTVNGSQVGAVTGTFQHFEVNSIFTLQAPATQGIDVADTPSLTVEVYPNPASGEAWIDLGSIAQQDVSISVYNNLGQLVHQVPESTIEGNLIQLNLQDWENGVYYLRVHHDGQEVATKKLICRND